MVRSWIYKQSQTRQAMTQRGFTLVEMALVLLVLGLFIGAVISFAEFENDKEALKETQLRQKRIAVAISDFANRYGHVPCPALLTSDAVYDSNFGWPDCSDGRVGIVPFRALGLGSDDIYDGYGNLMTFMVFRTANEASSLSTPVHRNCRLSAGPVAYQWIDPATAKNINAAKARFCCAQDTNAGEAVYTDNGMTVPAWPFLQILDPSAASEFSTNVDTAYAGTVSTRPLTYFAYTLISYGKNGNFAPIRIPGQPVARVPSRGTNQTSVYDDPNSGSIAFNNFYRSVRALNLSPGENYYDNIVLWRTQEQVIAETGVTNCRMP